MWLPEAFDETIRIIRALEPIEFVPQAGTVGSDRYTISVLSWL